MKKRINIVIFTTFLIVAAGHITAQEKKNADRLAAGPMSCYAEMREAMVWVQSVAPANVVMHYRERGRAVEWTETSVVRTSAENGFTAKLTAEPLEPGRHYEYKIVLNGKEQKFDYPTEFQTPKLWQWREDPPEFKVAAGSCLYVNETQYDRPGKSYGGGYEILTAIAAKKPDIMLWLGDNAYLREVDWYSRSGILHRYSHTRALPELQPLLASTQNYAIWDDHDFGPNDADRGFRAKDLTLEAFRLFWGNPSYGINGKPGITTTFEWGDVQFFLLDNRYYRTPNNRKTGERRMFGKEQIEWLTDNLVSSKATFKIIVTGGQILNTATKYETFARFPEERGDLLEAIRRENINGVIFVSGDIHSGELAVLQRDGTYPLYELTTSPLTSAASPRPDSLRSLALKETIVEDRNFAVIEFKGDKNNRTIIMRTYDKDGREWWNKTIHANELQAPVK
ncbi:MAG: alkaline phosphatase family protein [Bacteroidetes bacterium]|nr:alkaline phosphatase family protein [Bacteroidota bacterium]